MCYSAQVQQEHQRYVRQFGVQISLKDYVRLFWDRQQGTRPIKIPKAMEAQFADPQTPEEREIHARIRQWHEAEAALLEQALFKQRKRLVDAQRKLAVKPTQGAQDDQRIASSKIPWLLGQLSDLRRVDSEERDARIFPGDYVPVMVVEHGVRVLKPMRYQCRPPGVAAFFDQKYPGTYNARRDSLGGYWKKTFGYSHGVIVISAFYEHVERVKPDGNVEKLILKFEPDTHQEMLAAVLWAHWSDGKEELDSFALVTDEPPPEVAAAGHDRCIVPLKPEHLDLWLHPDPSQLDVLQAVLDDRERPFYEHRLAA